MNKTVSLLGKSVSLLLVALVLTGCQALAQLPIRGVAGTPVPTLTPVLLPPPTETPTPQAPVAAAAAATATPPATAEPLPTEGNPSTPGPTPAVSPATPSPRLLALGLRPTVTLRSKPAANAAAVIALPGSQPLWAEGRTADGKWLWVAYNIPPEGGEGSTGPAAGGREVAEWAWAARADLTLFGDGQTLPVVDPLQGAIAAAGAPKPSAGESTAASSSGGGTSSPAGGATSLEGRVLGAALNVRGGPGVDQPVLGRLNTGDAVSIVGRSQDSEWLALARPAGIALPEGQAVAWVAARYIEVKGKVSDLPVLATATSPVPTPAPAVAQGKVAFQTSTGGDIYIVGADGSGLRRVATGLDPVFSPDGTRLAYARWGSPHGIYVLDLRTGEERRVATAARPRSPSWSPDGQRLAFTYVTRDYVCLDTPFGCIDEAMVRQIFGGRDCIDTPMGRFCIADFQPRQAENFGLVQVTSGDGAWLDLPAQEKIQSPTWHPARDEILYRGNRGLQITAPGGTTHALVENVDLTSPAWSPDGQRIVAQIYLHDHADIFLLDAAGNVQKRLTAPASSTGRAANNVAPAWSPDGRSILFLSDRDGSWRLYRMNADGSGQAPFLPDVLSSITFSYNFAAERVVNWGR